MSRYVVIGGGIAGAALVRALADEGHSVVLVERDAIGAYAPPAALLHAVPGRSFDREPIEWSAFERAIQWMRSSDTPMVESTMVRPLSGRGGERLRASYERVRSSFPSWFEHALFSDRIEYSPAFSVDMRALAREWCSGAEVQKAEALAASRNRVQTDAGAIECDAVFVATGVREWGDLPSMRVYEGDLLMSSSWTPARMVSGGGHAAPLPDGGVSVGATVYEASEDVDVEEQIERLLERVRAHLPDLPSRTNFEVWHGARATVADRFPICGETRPGVFVVNSLGSRGLYWAPYLAEIAVSWLQGDAPPERLSIHRLDGESSSQGAGSSDSTR